MRAPGAAPRQLLTKAAPENVRWRDSDGTERTAGKEQRRDRFSEILQAAESSYGAREADNFWHEREEWGAQALEAVAELQHERMSIAEVSDAELSRSTAMLDRMSRYGLEDSRAHASAAQSQASSTAKRTKLTEDRALAEEETATNMLARAVFGRSRLSGDSISSSPIGRRLRRQTTLGDALTKAAVASQVASMGSNSHLAPRRV